MLSPNQVGGLVSLALASCVTLGSSLHGFGLTSTSVTRLPASWSQSVSSADLAQGLAHREHVVAAATPGCREEGLRRATG